MWNQQSRAARIGLSSLMLILSFGTARAPADDLQDMAAIKARIAASVLPPKPADKRALADTAAQDGRRLGANGSWPDIAYTDNGASAWKAAAHLERVLRMAKAYRTPGQPLFQSAALRDQTHRALDYWLDHDFRNPNWWWNQIGVPQQIGETLVLLEPGLTADERAKGDAIMKHAPLNGSGANLVWLAANNVLRGLLANDAATVAQSYARMYAELKVVPPDQEGVQADWSFHQHGRQLYSGGYGYFYGDDLARYTAFAWGTRFQIPPDRLQFLLHYLLDGQRWMVRGQIFDYSTIGREITRADLVAVPTNWVVGPISPPGAAYGMPHAIALLAACPVPRRDELTALAALLNGSRGATAPTGNRGFWMSDYVAHERPNYLATVRLCSNRMFNSEIVNNEGRRSQHLGDGATYIYQSGNEYRDIFPVWDWQRVPGTTCVQLTKDPYAPAQVHVAGQTRFVGSVSDGRYGLAAVDFARGPLTAHKSWFFADDGFVCLGAGVTATADDTVLTSINQCLLHGPVRVSGRPTPLATGSSVTSSLNWVWHDGVGYAFPAATSVHVAAQPQSGRWSDIGTGADALVTRDVFSLWLDHGPHPQNVTYAYIVLPGCQPGQIAARAAGFEVLRNTPAVQAVRSRAAGLLQAAFWQAGMVDAGAGWRVSVDQPCLLQFQRGRDGAVHLTASNPENKPLVLTVTLDGALMGPGCTPAADGHTEVRLDLPDGPQAGSSITVTLQPKR